MTICSILFDRCVIDELKRLGESHSEALHAAHELAIARSASIFMSVNNFV